MSFNLSSDFPRLVNEMGQLLRDFEAEVDAPKSQEFLKRLLITACQILSEIDIPGLEKQIHAVFISADSYNKTWFEQVVADQAHFSYFLHRVESAIIVAAGVDQATKDRILVEVDALRSTAVNVRASVTPSAITHGIDALRQDVCHAKEQVIDLAHHRAMHTKLVKVLCVVAIVTNATASVLGLEGSPAAWAASIVVGGTRFIPAP